MKNVRWLDVFILGMIVFIVHLLADVINMLKIIIGIFLLRFIISYPLAHTIVLAFKTLPQLSTISLSPSLFVNIFFRTYFYPISSFLTKTYPIIFIFMRWVIFHFSVLVALFLRILPVLAYGRSMSFVMLGLIKEMKNQNEPRKTS